MHNDSDSTIAASAIRSATLRRAGVAGVGLLGMLIVLAIVLALYFGNFSGSGSYADKLVETKESGERLNVELNTRQLMILIATHRQTYGELPRDYEAMEQAPTTFLDPWKKPLRFEYAEGAEAAGATGRVEVIVTSAGPDQEFDTEDDIQKIDQLPF